VSFSLPNVGDVITVTTYYDSNVIGRSVAEDTKVYEKVQVIQPFGWTKPNAFCIPAEGEPFIKIRTISLNAVTDIVVHEGVDAEGCTSGTKFVYVPGSKGNEYMVTVVDGFGVECQCLGYTYRGQCKHLKIASDETEAA
jgi:hypothetical protein